MRGSRGLHGKVQIPPTPEFWQPQHRLEHYSPLPSQPSAAQHPRTRSRTTVNSITSQSVSVRPRRPRFPSQPRPPTTRQLVPSLVQHLRLPLLTWGSPRSSRRRPRPRPRRRTTRSQATDPIPSPFRCKSAAMATLGDDLLGTVNKLQDLVFNTIGNDSLDLPQIVRGHAPRSATPPAQC